MTKVLQRKLDMIKEQMGTLRTAMKIYKREPNGSTNIQISEMKNLMSKLSGRLDIA